MTAQEWLAARGWDSSAGAGFIDPSDLSDDDRTSDWSVIPVQGGPL